MTIGEAIREIRIRQGLSQGDLAERAGITQGALSQIESGRRPGKETLANIAKVLKAPEPLIHIMTVEKEDIPESKQFMFDQLFPVIKELILQIAGE